MDPPPSPSPPSPPHLNLTTTAAILHRSSTVFLSHLPTFILLSLLILTFRSNLDTGATLLTSFIDSDPSLGPLLRRLDDLPTSGPPSHLQRRRRPFLHLTRVGTLDDDFFSGDRVRQSQFAGGAGVKNATPVFLSYPFHIFGKGNRNNELMKDVVDKDRGDNELSKDIVEKDLGKHGPTKDIPGTTELMKDIVGNPELMKDVAEKDLGEHVSTKGVIHNDDSKPELTGVIAGNDHVKHGLPKDVVDNDDSKTGLRDEIVDSLTENAVGNDHQDYHFFDEGIRFSEIVHPGVSFRLVESASQLVNGSEELGEEESEEVKQEDERDGVVDLGFIVKGLELRRRDASALFFLVSLLSAAYGYVIAGFVMTYSWVLGIVFLEVVNHYLGRNRSFFRTVWGGSTLGVKRLSGFILMKWAVRDALTQLLGLWYFGEIEDQYSFFKIFVRLKLMPFSITSSWIKGFEKETAGFMFAWLMMDLVVEFIFALDSWVAIVDSRRTGREIVKEGCYLLSTMSKPAVTIKCLESIFCGSYVKWSLSRYFGKLFGTAFQSLMEVYFMVTWLIFYFAVKSKEATSIGRTFGQRELEGFIQGHR